MWAGQMLSSSGFSRSDPDPIGTGRNSEFGNKTFPALIQYLYESFKDIFCFEFRISDIRICFGLPSPSRDQDGIGRCDLPAIYYRFLNISKLNSFIFWHFKISLGQGFRIYKKLIKQIILKLHQVTSLNDIALGDESVRKGTSYILIFVKYYIRKNLC